MLDKIEVNLHFIVKREEKTKHRKINRLFIFFKIHTMTWKIMINTNETSIIIKTTCISKLNLT